MIVIPFEPDHLRRLTLQPHQARTLSVNGPSFVPYLTQAGPAYTALIDSCVLACAGIILCDGVGTLWAYIAADAGRHFVRLHRAAQRLIGLQPLRRLEASTEADFIPGCRWLELLGFQSEGILRQYGPHGEDHLRYARIWPLSPR